MLFRSTHVFNGLISEDKAKLDFYPEELRKEIDEVNTWVYDKINSVLHFRRDLDPRDRESNLPQMVYTSLVSQQPSQHIVMQFFLSLRLLTVLRGC